MPNETPEQQLARLLMAQGSGAAPAMPPQALAQALGRPQVQNTFDPQPVDPNTPSGERPLVGGGLQNALDMLAQSGPAQKAQTYARALMDAARHPGDAYSGREPAYLGLRREDFSDDPNAPQPNARAIASGVTLGDVMSMGSMPVAAMAGAERGALGVGVPPKTPLDWRQFTKMGRLEQTADAAHAAIQDALKAGRPPNSGVPLMAPTSTGPKPTTEEVLAAINEALKLAPK